MEAVSHKGLEMQGYISRNSKRLLFIELFIKCMYFSFNFCVEGMIYIYIYLSFRQVIEDLRQPQHY